MAGEFLCDPCALSLKRVVEIARFACTAIAQLVDRVGGQILRAGLELREQFGDIARRGVSSWRATVSDGCLVAPPASDASSSSRLFASASRA